MADQITRGKRRTTQADVAHRAKVSQALVSYVVNNNQEVSIPLATRQRIEVAMRELGYVPNITARRLRANKTFTVAGIIPDITNPFYPAFERGIQDTLDNNGYDLVMYNSDGDRCKEERYVKSLLQGRVDGVVGVFFHLNAKDLLPLIEQNISVIRLEATAKPAGVQPLDNVYIDNIAAARLAVEFLIDKGHRRIGMLSSKEGPARFRQRGYQEAILDSEIPLDADLIATGSYNEDGGYQAMKELLRLDPLPTAVFAANDVMAMGAMLAIRGAGLLVPADVAVVGFDDIPSAKLVYPALTTIRQFQHRMGQHAAEMLLERLQGQAVQHGRSVSMHYELVIRDSA